MIGLLLLLGGLYAVGYVLSGDRVPRGTSVAGVDIGGLSAAQAEEKLQRDLAPRAERPIIVRHRDKTYKVVPSEAGLSLDVAETVSAAGGGRSLNPLRLIDGLTGGGSVDPVVSVDEPSLDAVTGRLAPKVGRAPVEGMIRFRDGRPEPVAPRSGYRLDASALGEELQAALLDRKRALEVPMRTVPTEVSNRDVEQALESFARPAMSEAVEVNSDGRTAQLSPATIGDSLSMRPRNGKLTPRLDKQSLKHDAEKALGRLTTRPRPATVELRDGSPKVIPRKVGTTVDTKRLADDLLQVLAESGEQRTVTADTKPDKPRFSTRDARKLRIKEIVSEFSTVFPHSSYRNTNLGQAAESINGTMLKPGETFSFNDVVGERTAENGFTKGYIIDDGVLVEDFGGGVSQVATTVYNAGFFAGLKDVEHHPHSLYFDRYPIGREATVAWGALDLQFQNNTPYGVLVETWIEPSSPSSDGEMHARIWSTDHWDVEAGRSGRYNETEPDTRYDPSDECVEQVGVAGFDIDIHRYLERDGDRVRTETDTVTYDAADTVHCRAAPR